MMKRIALALCVAWLGVCGWVRATETENIGIRVLPAPGKVVIDGQYGDWDLSGGIFTPSGFTPCTTRRTSTSSPAGTTTRP